MGDEFVQRGFVAVERRHAYTSVAFEAIAVAGRARTGVNTGKYDRPDTNGVTNDQVDNLRARAEQELPQGDDLRAAILTFATHYEVHRRDKKAVQALGEALASAVHTILNPPAPERFRADIDG